MKMNRHLLYCCSVVVIMFFLSGCAVPRLLWPQKDVTASGTAIPDKRQAVLIASRSSEYKETLVAELHKQLASVNIPQKTIGIDDLREFDSSDYAAIIVINTCLAWGLDHDVETFLKQQKSHSNIILITTSEDGEWLPNKHGRDFDAVSGASTMTNIDAMTRDLMARIRKRLNQQDTPRK